MKTLRAFLFFCITPFVLLSAKIELTREDASHFPGWVSLAPEEIFLALKHCQFTDTLNIIEFGAGQGTTLLAELLRSKKVPFEYHTFENDFDYIQNIEGVTYHHYPLPDLPWGEPMRAWTKDIDALEMPQLPTADLIIVDGPHGVARAAWYPKFKPFTKPGTILLIDDFHHLFEFGEALDANFNYETIIEYNTDPNWILINDGLDPSPNPDVGKTFKIVRILD